MINTRILILIYSFFFTTITCAAQEKTYWYASLSVKPNVLFGKSKVKPYGIYFCCNTTDFEENESPYVQLQTVSPLELRFGYGKQNVEFELLVDYVQRDWQEFSTNVYFTTFNNYVPLPDGSLMGPADTILFEPHLKFNSIGIGINISKTWQQNGWRCGLGISYNRMINIESYWEYRGVIDNASEKNNDFSGVNGNVFSIYHAGLEKRIWQRKIIECWALLHLGYSRAFQSYHVEMRQHYYAVSFPFWLETGLGLSVRCNLFSGKQEL